MTTAQPIPLDLPTGGVLGAIVRINLAVTDVLEQIAATAGLTFADYLVLGVIRRSAGGRSAPTAIANVLGRTTGGMTLALDRLEAKGLLLRTRHSADGRRVVVELTAAGRRVATKINDRLHEWERGLTLPVEAARVVSLLDAVTDAVTAAR
jgi:DNA-binding MarR family transcriptional regulator